MDIHAAGDLRVSDAEREPVIERLQVAYSEGRLDHDEFDMRMHLAMTAKTRGDLSKVLFDLQPVQYEGKRKGGNPAPWTGVGDGPWTGAAPTGEERVWAAVAHAIGYPTVFVGPLVLMLWKGRSSAYIRRHAAEAVNFQLTVLLAVIVTFGLLGFLYAVTWIVAAVAAIVALAGGSFRYPFILRLIK
ncbi:DUF1707 and DUF4870 domain-containing protein [Actinomadura barringtoniae]|uniref:DUF1707 and DUF4870 domain-containing protein n=1 Tax=Actinomadura barringtoniae TaxID=1427535 RepID=A0A939PPL8_9ACTN|nr:DUF1707 and DUF4870 domain-containing protein [Actinomadura barringtoniae]MBO2455818.1 DUF1707 and DUF4870 domain-containing protein [Actinomadura barringtoniae]